MTKQPHYGPNGPAPVFANGSRGADAAGRRRAQDAEAYAQASAAPPPVDLALLERGQASVSRSSARHATALRETATAPSSGAGFRVRRPTYDAALMRRPGAAVLRHDHQRLRRDVLLRLPRFPA